MKFQKLPTTIEELDQYQIARREDIETRFLRNLMVTFIIVGATLIGFYGLNSFCERLVNFNTAIHKSF